MPHTISPPTLDTPASISSRSMRAFVIDGSSGIESIRQVALPVPFLAPNEVLIRVGAVSLNYRDLLVIRGEEEWRPQGPRILCSDGAGIIAAVGAEVTLFRPGDRVANCFKQEWLSGRPTLANSGPGPGARTMDGVLAEYRAFPQHAVVRLPDCVTIEEGSTLPCAALTAWNAVIERSPLVPGQRVMVFGSGGVSVFALQFARLAGAEVWAMTRRAERAEQLTRLGAHRVIVADSAEAMSRQLEREGELVDTIIDVVGGDLNPQARILTPDGRLVALGCAGSMTNTIDHRFMPARIDAVSVGSRDMFLRMLRAIEHHAVRPAIDRVFPFDEAVNAFRHLAEGRSFGKVVIRVSETDQHAS